MMAIVALVVSLGVALSQASPLYPSALSYAPPPPPPTIPPAPYAPAAPHAPAPVHHEAQFPGYLPAPAPAPYVPAPAPYVPAPAPYVPAPAPFVPAPAPFVPAPAPFVPAPAPYVPAPAPPVHPPTHYQPAPPAAYAPASDPQAQLPAAAHPRAPEGAIQLPEGGRVLLTDDHLQYTQGFNDKGTKVSEQGRLITTNDGWEAVIVKEGSYSYTSPEGIPITVNYIADENGFRVLSR